jgi:hypothetical protein
MIEWDRRTMVSMRRGLKRAASGAAKGKRPPAKVAKLSPGHIARIRERREQIYEREGVLSDSALLIREDRDR